MKSICHPWEWGLSMFWRFLSRWLEQEEHCGDTEVTQCNRVVPLRDFFCCCEDPFRGSQIRCNNPDTEPIWLSSTRYPLVIRTCKRNDRRRLKDENWLCNRVVGNWYISSWYDWGLARSTISNIFFVNDGLLNELDGATIGSGSNYTPLDVIFIFIIDNFQPRFKSQCSTLSHVFDMLWSMIQSRIKVKCWITPCWTHIKVNSHVSNIAARCSNEIDTRAIMSSSYAHTFRAPCLRAT